MGAFSIFCLLVQVLARYWILGFVICSINWYITIFYNFFFLLIYLVISRDKLKEVKDPIKGRSTNKRAYLNSALVWFSSSSVAIGLYITWIFRNLNQLDSLSLIIEHGHFICFGLSNQGVDEMLRLILLSLSLFCLWVTFTVIVAVTFSNFMYILVELQKLKIFRLRRAKEAQARENITIDKLDKPIFRTGEQRTAKSLTFIFFIQFSCVFISVGMTFAQAISNFIQPQGSTDFKFYFMILLIVEFFPCINPVFLILSNKRFRTRVKELFKCTLTPETEASPVHNVNLIMVKANKASKFIFPMKKNQISPEILLE